MDSRLKKATIWGGWAISLMFLGWAFWSIDFSKVVESFRMINPVWLVPAFILNFSILLVRTARWNVFVEAVKPVRFISAFAALCIGFMANMLLPARIGEIVRALVLAESEDIPKGKAFGTVVVERAFDGLCVVILAMLVFALITPTHVSAESMYGMKLSAVFFSSVLILVFAATFMFHKRYRPVVWAIEVFTGLLPEKWGVKIRDFLESIRQGLHSIDHGHRILKIALWSIPVWGLAGPFNYCFIMAFGLDLPFSASFFVLISQVVGLLIPSAPGFIGVYHAATMGGLMLYGVDQDMALSVAVLMHLVVFIAQTAPGFFFMWKMSYSLSDIRKKEEAAEEEGLETDLEADEESSEKASPPSPVSGD